MAKPRSSAHVAWGNALRQLRAERSLSQEALAHVAHLDRTFVSGIERGDRNPTLATLFKITSALGVPVSELALRAERGSSGQRPPGQSR